jgi:hypothetical protein
MSHRGEKSLKRLNATDQVGMLTFVLLSTRPLVFVSICSGPQSLRDVPEVAVPQDRKLHQLSVPVRSGIASDEAASSGSSWDETEVARQIAMLTEERNFLRKYGQEDGFPSLCVTVNATYGCSHPTWLFSVLQSRAVSMSSRPINYSILIWSRALAKTSWLLSWEVL